MKKIFHSLQGLGQKAAQIKQAVETAPATAARLRESILLTAGQLQQARSEVQATFTGLRADSEPRLTQALQELNDSASLLPEAGYALAGVDMEVSPVQRLVVHLQKIGPTSDATLRSLLSSNAHRPTIHALLSSLAKADALASEVGLSNLEYAELVVHIGPTPSVRLCWRPEEIEETVEVPGTAPARPMTVPAPSVPATPSPPPLPVYGQGSYFEPRPAAPASPPPAPASAQSPAAEPAAAPPLSASAPAPIRVSPPAQPQPAGGDWKATALDRFKKMPGVSKYRKV